MNRRYVWTPTWVNEQRKSKKEPPIPIADSSAARDLLQLGHGYRDCHRSELGSFLLKEAMKRYPKPVLLQGVPKPGL